MRKCIVALILCFFPFVSAAHATIAVVIVGSGSTSNSSPSSGEAFTLTASGTVLFKVYSDTSTDDIGRITLTGTGPASLLIGNSGDFPSLQSTSFSSPLARDWDGLELNSYSGTIRVAGRIARNLTGSMTATQIFRLQVENDVTDVVTATGVDVGDNGSYAMGPVIVGHSITSTGGVTANAYPTIAETVTLLDVEVGTVNASGSDLAGTVSVPNGLMMNVAAAGNVSGTVSAVVLGNHFFPGDFDGIVIAGELSGTITIGAGAYANVIADSFSSGSSLMVYGNLEASVLAAGNISTIFVGGGIVGYNATPLQIVSSSGSIGAISAGDILSDAVGGVFINAAEGIGSLDCESMSRVSVGTQTFGSGHPGVDVGEITVSGNVFGSSLHLGVFDSIDIGGDLSSWESISGNVHTLLAAGRIVTGSVPSASRLRIGGALQLYSEIKTESTTPGLEGQIIINAGAETVDPLVGDVSVRTGSSSYHTITAPDYTFTSASLGGGAVGVVPYRMQAVDSEPENGTLVCEMPTRYWRVGESMQERETMVIHLTGPVFDSLPTSGDIPVIVERRSMICAVGHCCWEQIGANISTSCSVRVGEGTNRREVWVCMATSGAAVPFANFYEYRVKPRFTETGLTDLRSDDTFVYPGPNVYDFVYGFSFGCLEDFRSEGGGGGGATNYDIDSFDALLSVDLNRDGVVDEADLVELMARLGMS